MLVTVKVEQWHIDNGECLAPGKCAGALAIQEHVRLGIHVHVGCCYITMSSIYDCINIITPNPLRDFIYLFDRNKRSAKPISFQLNIPDAFLRTPAAPVADFVQPTPPLPVVYAEPVRTEKAKVTT